jgi:hypothetical protein
LSGTHPGYTITVGYHCSACAYLNLQVRVQDMSVLIYFHGSYLCTAFANDVLCCLTSAWPHLSLPGYSEVTLPYICLTTCICYCQECSYKTPFYGTKSLLRQVGPLIKWVPT